MVLDSLTLETETLGDQVKILYNSSVTNYQSSGSEWSDKPITVTLSDGTELTTDLVIGADGFRSGLRQSMKGQRYMTFDYEKMAIVATLLISENEANVTAWQRFLPTGPVALLPLSNQLSSLVWSTDKEEARRLLDLPTEAFVDALNQALWSDVDRNSLAEQVTQRVSDVVTGFLQDTGAEESVRQLPPSIVDVQGQRAAFPLATGHAVCYVDNRMALIGDAAHRVHPMAGQGVNLGFGDVQLLTRVLENAVSHGADIGSPLYLRDYQSGRLRHNLPVMATIHGLHFLYGSTWTPAVLARSLGVNILDKLPHVKRIISSRAAV